MSQCRENFVRPLKDLRDRINETLIIARLMSFDRRRNRRHNIVRAALPRQEDLNARAGGLRGLDENEFVFVRKNHFPEGTSRTLVRAWLELA